MTVYTPISAIPTPDLTDAPNAPLQLLAIGNAIDGLLTPTFASTAARDATIAAPVEGARCYISGHGPQVYVGGSWQYTPLGLVSTVATTGTNGTATSSTTDTRDAVLGNSVFTAVANRVYRINYSGSAFIDTASASYAMNVRDGGASTPTSGSTSVTIIQIPTTPAVNLYAPVVCQSILSNPSVGVHTLSAFHSRFGGSGILTPNAVRTLWVEDIGGV